jgi:lipoprotein-releasing system ATP-binding protein
LLIADQITKQYETAAGKVDVLAGVTIQLARGESASIMGPSGSGKSTLLSILGALEAPTSGKIELDGENPFELAPKQLAAFRNRRIGFIFQDHCLLPQCTVLENVLIPTLVAPAAQGGYTERARELIRQVGLLHRLEHLPSQLSGGEKQRAAIARALILQPDLLLCDEPTGNLDRRTAESISQLLASLHAQHNTVLIVVTHNEQLAQAPQQRFELADGRLVRR